MLDHLSFALTLWRAGIDRARLARGHDRDLGASALEWAIISAILVTAAVFIGGIVYTVVKQKGTDLEKCANQPVGSAGC
jgi:hypothetical protein